MYASLYVTEADIGNLEDPTTWTVRDHTCDIAAQDGHPLHGTLALGGVDLCDIAWGWGPQFSHSPDDNADGSRLYVASQGADDSNPYAVEVGVDLRQGPGTRLDVHRDNTLRIIDMTEDPPRLIAEIEGPGHSLDWFSRDGREYVLHANEGGSGNTSVGAFALLGLLGVPVPVNQGDGTPPTCRPHPRPSTLGWAFEVFVTEVTNDIPKRVSMLELAINTLEFCQDDHPSISQHSLDTPYDANFAMVNWGNAGLRVFDIRDPDAPAEVAYFNRGSLVHSGVAHYDAARGLMYLPTGDAFRVLEIQPQVYGALGLPEPKDPAYPRYPNGRPVGPAD